MHLFLTDSDSRPFLADELRRHAPAVAQHEIPGLGIASDVPLDGLLLAFARQTLPNAVEAQAASINAWADRIIEAVAGVIPDDQPWRLHLWPQYGEGKAGLNRCELIRTALAERLKKKRRHLLRSWVQDDAPARSLHTKSTAGAAMAQPAGGPSSNLSPKVTHVADPTSGGERDRHFSRIEFSRNEKRFPAPHPGPSQGREASFGEKSGEGPPKALAADLCPIPFSPTTSLVQCVLTAPEAGWISMAAAPLPHAHPSLISAFPCGEVPLADDKSAPSRAFTKLVESEQRLGQFIERGQTCVDLGASPGSWSYVAIQRGAHVIAVDRSELREDLMRNPRLRFETADAFKYRPPEMVDWLVCDVIAAPQRSIDLLLEWLRERRMRNFIVTIKFKGHEEYPLLDILKREAPPLCVQFHLKRLCANKNEVCAFGRV